MTLSAPPAAFDPANIHDTVERLLHDFLEQQKRAAPDLQKSLCSPVCYAA